MKKERDSIPISRKARGKEVAPARKRLIREWKEGKEEKR
jgi:hypothetical protein